MRKFFIIILLLTGIIIPVYASETEPPEVPEVGEYYMPDDTESFAEGLWFVLQKAIGSVMPEIPSAASSCIGIIAVMLIISFADSLPGSTQKAIHLCGALTIGYLVISPSNALIALGATTIQQMAEYGKLLLPALTAALAAQGGVSSSAVLYAGTSFFTALLCNLISSIMIPLLYVYMCTALVNAVCDDKMVSNMVTFCKWLITWCLKILLYVFIAYMGITGVISGTADATAVRATKLTIAGMIPVVGNIVSEASESIIVSAGMMKNTTGVYGILAIIAVFIVPFLKIGIQYLLLKITAAISSVFGFKQESGLLTNFSGGMGMLLGMTGTVCMFLLIGVVCMMKGMS